MDREVIYDPTRRWMEDPRRACKGADLDVIFSGPNACWDKPSKRREEIWRDWIEVHCERCPVLAQCERDTLGEEHGIWGGKTQRDRFLERRRIERNYKKWPEERRLFWGGEVAGFHAAGWDYSQIARRTGLNKVVAIALEREYQQREKERRAEQEEKQRQDRLRAAQEAEKALAGRTVHALPDKPGDKDLWVRHRGQVFDATYRAHSEDGLWVRADIRQIRAMPWIPVKDCRIYRAVPKKIQPKGRSKYGRAA